MAEITVMLPPTLEGYLFIKARNGGSQALSHLKILASQGGWRAMWNLMLYYYNKVNEMPKDEYKGSLEFKLCNKYFLQLCKHTRKPDHITEFLYKVAYPERVAVAKAIRDIRSLLSGKPEEVPIIGEMFMDGFYNYTKGNYKN